MQKDQTICLKTPFAYKEVMQYLFDVARCSIQNLTSLVFDPKSNMHSSRTILDVSIFFYASMSVHVDQQLAAHSLQVWEWLNNCVGSHRANTYFPAAEDDNQDKMKMHVLLECGDNNNCMTLPELCKTYFISLVRKDDTNTTQNLTQQVIEKIFLPRVHDTLLVELKSKLNALYVTTTQRILATALKQGKIECKIPLDTPSQTSVAKMKQFLVHNDNWTDAPLFLMLSSNDETLSLLLESWPFENYEPTIHRRILNHYDALLQTRFRLSRPIDAFRAACAYYKIQNEANIDFGEFAHTFLRNWAVRNWTLFTELLILDTPEMVRALLDFFLPFHEELLPLFASRLNTRATCFKDMARLFLPFVKKNVNKDNFEQEKNNQFIYVSLQSLFVK